MTKAPKRITTLLHELRSITDDPLPNQRFVYAATVSARIPAHQINGIWHYYEADLPTIRDTFGLRPKLERADRSALVAAAEHASAA